MMRVRKEEKDFIKKQIMDTLKNSKSSFNLSELARAIGKSPPTVLNYVKELEASGKVTFTDKKSMKLVELKEEKKCQKVK